MNHEQRIKQLESDLAGARFAAQQHLATVETLQRLLAREWNPVEGSLPDDDLLVVVALEDGEVWPGFLDGGVWRDSGGAPFEVKATHWTTMLPHPVGVHDQATGVPAALQQNGGAA